MTANDGSVSTAEPTLSDGPRLSFGAKLWNLFVDPRKTFASGGHKHEWVILWILVSLIAIGTYLPIKPIVKQSQIEAIEERLDQNPQITPEQRQEIIESVEQQFENPLYLLFVPVSQLVVLFIVAGILLFFGNIILGGRIGFSQMLNAYAWTMMIAIPAGIITVPMVLAKESMDVSIGLGILASPETGAFLKSFLSSLEVFALWQVWLSAVAISVLAQTETNKAFWTVAAAWLVWIIAKAGLATLGVQFGA